MRVFLCTLLFLPLTCLAAFKEGAYVGGGLGWSRLSADRTLGWDRDVLRDIWFAEGAPQKGSGFDDTLFAGWLIHCKTWVWGAEVEFGYGSSKTTFKASNPYKKTDVFVSDLSMGPRGSLFFMGGYGLSGWMGLLRLGYTCARFIQAYEDREGDFVEDFRHTRNLSHGLSLGGMVQKEITYEFAARLSYTYTFHGRMEDRFRNGWDDTTVVQKAAYLRSQRVMVSIVWYPWRREKCFDTLS